jgi:RND family efflux transporter MFP subunit
MGGKLAGAAAAFLAIFLAGRALYSKNEMPAVVTSREAPSVAAAHVTRSDLARTVTLSAEFQPFQQVDVHAKVAGYLKSIRVDVGDHVKAGDSIGVLEIPELDDDLKKAAAATRAAREDVKRAEAHGNEIHRETQRLLKVAKERPNLVAQQDIDAATAEDESAGAALASARQHVEESEANESRMRTMVAYNRITAPFAGVITHRYADVGALIQAGTSSSTQSMPVVSLAEDGLLRLVFPVPESAVSFIHDGTSVGVEVSALQRTFRGRVARFSGAVDRATRTMQTEVDVPNDDLRLTPGMYASVTIALEERPNALSVPVQALSGGQAMVVGPDGILEARTVRLGLETPERVEVLDGLNEKDVVVVSGRSQLRSGDKVIAKIGDDASVAAGPEAHS